MVSVQRRNMQGQVQACVAVFSSATREWKILPWVKIPIPLQPEDDGEEMLKFHAGMQANGFIYWKHMSQPYVLILNTATLKFSRVDLPLVLGEVESELFSLSHTKDGKLCMVAADVSDADTGTLVVWFWRADDDGIEKWMFEQAFPLDTFIDVTKGNARLRR
uniref:Uncharacterized protein n=1 Tax=Avena sativa TaxID=4498 RepID=A0ACD5XP64_AVESA